MSIKLPKGASKSGDKDQIETHAHSDLGVDSDAEFLLKRLHKGGNFWYLWTKMGGKNRSVWSRVGERIIVPDKWDNVYFNVHPSDKHRTSARHKIENVKVVNSLYAEFDEKDFGGPEELQEHIKGLEPWASYMLHSGGGYHAYWFLDETYEINNEADLEFIQDLQTAWVEYVGGDTGAHDLARVLRLPGTENHKYDPPRPVKTLTKSSVTHDIDELYSLAEPFMEKKTVAAVTEPVETPVGLPEGSRNVALHKKASSYQARGFSDYQIDKMVRYVNSTMKPPMDDDEVDQILENVLKYQKGEKKPKPRADEWFVIAGALGYEFRMRILDDRLMTNDRLVDDVTIAEIKTELRDFGFRDVLVALDAFEGKSEKFHPIKDYLESLEWDGKDHISELLTYFTSSDGLFEDFGLRRWLVGAIERIYMDGKQNRVLVLDGDQGIGKSFFVRWLGTAAGPEYYAEISIDPEDKDNRIRLMNTWIWEVPELGAVTLRRDIEALKHFLSRERVTERHPYRKYDVNKPAGSSFIATVNNQFGFLNDATGNRRFMSTTLTHIDWDFKKHIDKHQVWAQAKALFDQGETGDLNEKEAKIAETENERYEVDNPIWDVMDRQVLITESDDDFIPTESILQRIRDKGIRASDQEIYRQIKAWSLDNKIDKGRGYVDGVQIRGYRGVALKVTMAQSWMEANGDE